MHVTVRRYEGVTDPTEAGRRVNEGFLAIISKVPGFVAYYWADAGGGVMISTSIFENQSGAEESTKRAEDLIVRKPFVPVGKTGGRFCRAKIVRLTPGSSRRPFASRSEPSS